MENHDGDSSVLLPKTNGNVDAEHGPGNSDENGESLKPLLSCDSDGVFKGNDNISKSVFSWYLVLLSTHPVTTKAVTSALLMLFGDLMCQLIFERSETVDLKRVAVFALLGLALVGPTLHVWYLYLSKLVPGLGAGKAGLRLVIDQLLFAPIFIGVFFSSLLILEGHSSKVIPKLKQDWLNAVVANWKIWIPFQFLNFLLVPQPLQVLAANVIALAWNVYLSFATHKVVAPTQTDVLSG